MKRAVALSVVLGSLWVAAVAQEQSDCPPRTVINNGVCIGKNGKDCSKREAQSRICYDPDPQYTDQAAKANIKGTVRLTATLGTDGCADKIKVVGSLGYGLDEAAVFALERFRFRKPAKPVPINVEFDFDPRFSSRDPVSTPKCADEVRRRSSPDL
jgi:TonB family protein